MLCGVALYSAGQRGITSHSRAFHVVECIVLHESLLRFYMWLLPDAENAMRGEGGRDCFNLIIFYDKK